MKPSKFVRHLEIKYSSLEHKPVEGLPAETESTQRLANLNF
jgi:hypothetical protein